MPHLKTNMLTARSWRRSNWSPIVRVALWAILFSTILVGVMIAATFFFYNAVRRLESHFRTGRSELEQAELHVQGLRLSEAIAHLDSADVEFVAAQHDLFRLKILKIIPGLGPTVAAADGLLAGSRSAISSLRPALTAAESVLSELNGDDLIISFLSGGSSGLSQVLGDLTAERKRQILASLYENAPQIRLSAVGLDRSIEIFEGIDASAFGPETELSLAAAVVKLRKLHDGLDSVSVAAELLPSLLGYPGPRRYLVFFQNNSELRPTGGFLGVYGLVEVMDGSLVSTTVDDVYALDGPSESTERPVPPEPIRRYINIDKWYLRDANWSPDFPTSAEVMERFFHEESVVVGSDPGELDGIVALTPELASDLLRIVGPVSVDGKTFTAENLVDQLEFEVERNYIAEGIPFHARKGIVGDLTDELLARLTALPLLDQLAVLEAVEANLAESQVLFWFHDSELERFVLDRDWGGRLSDTTGDYVSVIDANLASYKSDPVVLRTVGYSIRPSGDRFEAAVSVTYDHHGQFDWKTTRYRTYARVYVPAGAELLGVDGAMYDDRLKDPARRPGQVDVYSESGRTVLGAFISVEPKEKRTLTFRYLLPESVTDQIEAGEYSLYFEKQPGTVAYGLTLDLDFGKNLTSASPAEDPSEFGDSHFIYGTDLRLDRSFGIVLQKP
ncbi:MAG: hypothetical protein AUJ19_03625 [Parcubacteria group bacterium CG1_02_58_44]|nr:MAG: hypothetical protein AUJ19_03625 [Parcubacteria group bacterium CG1_02_58_44]